MEQPFSYRKKIDINPSSSSNLGRKCMGRPLEQPTHVPKTKKTIEGFQRFFFIINYRVFRHWQGRGRPESFFRAFSKRGTMSSVMSPALSLKKRKEQGLRPQSPTLFHPPQALFGPLAPCAPPQSTSAPPRASFVLWFLSLYALHKN